MSGIEPDHVSNLQSAGSIYRPVFVRGDAWGAGVCTTSVSIWSVAGYLYSSVRCKTATVWQRAEQRIERLACHMVVVAIQLCQ